MVIGTKILKQETELRNNRQNVQLGIKCTIRHLKLEIEDWGLDIGDWEIGWNRLT